MRAMEQRHPKSPAAEPRFLRAFSPPPRRNHIDSHARACNCESFAISSQEAQPRPMYHFVDRPLLSLPGEARMLLGAMRLWRVAYRAHHCPAAALMPLFVGTRAAAIAPMHMVMAIMLLDAAHPLEIDASGTPFVSEGEAVFLA